MSSVSSSLIVLLFTRRGLQPIHWRRVSGIPVNQLSFKFPRTCLFAFFHRLKDEDDPLFTQRLAEGVLKQQSCAGKFTSTMQLVVSLAMSWAVHGLFKNPCVPSQASKIMRWNSWWTPFRVPSIACVWEVVWSFYVETSGENGGSAFSLDAKDLPDRGCFSHKDDTERLMQLFIHCFERRKVPL